MSEDTKDSLKKKRRRRRRRRRRSNTKTGFGTDTRYSEFWNKAFSKGLKGRSDSASGMIRLAAQKRSISNFVRILTEKRIPVVFYDDDGGMSYTDGEKVVISADLSPDNFDAQVGVALHEGSHIVHSDFDLIKRVAEGNETPKEILEVTREKGYDDKVIHGKLKLLLNYVEDRRIDHLTYTAAPGYRGYYQSMYARFWNHRLISKGLQSGAFRVPTLESYEYRIINLTNPDTDFNALPDLDKIWNILDLRNVDRIKTTQDAFDIALEIFEVIVDNIVDYQPDFTIQMQAKNCSSEIFNDMNPSSGSGQTPDMIVEVDFGDGGDEEDEDSTSGEDGEDGDSEDSEDDSEGSGGGSGDGEEEEWKGPKDGEWEKKLSKRQEKELPKKIKNQEDFLEGDTHKKSLTKDQKSVLDAIEKSGTTIMTTGGNNGGSPGDGPTPKGTGIPEVEVIVVNKLNKEILNSSVGAGLKYNRGGKLVENPESVKAISKGIKIGDNLARKIQIRTEDRVTRYTRQKSGRIDKRLIAELGTGNERVFSTMEIDSYNDVFLRISVDASGSMSGSKWVEALALTVAIARASSKIENFDVAIDFRTTIGNSYGATPSTGYSQNDPVVIVAYDSRVDGFSKVTSLFKYLSPNGMTPEGLCFEAIMNQMVEGHSRGKDSFFLNMSDGAPNLGAGGQIHYSGEVAKNHTRQQVNRMVRRGIRILSYFIRSNRGYGDRMDGFTHMYGSAAKEVNSDNVTAIARTLNHLLTEKN